MHLTHPIEIAAGVVSLGMFLGTLVAVPIFLVKVPDDYFTRPRAPLSLPLRVLRITLGVGLIVLGIVMLLLPGQGVLTILVGLGILEAPLKDRIIARILRNPPVRHAVDKLRRKAGKGPLEIPGPLNPRPRFTADLALPRWGLRPPRSCAASLPHRLRRRPASHAVREDLNSSSRPCGARVAAGEAGEARRIAARGNAVPHKGRTK